MSHNYTDNALSIGRTPWVELQRITDGAPVSVLAKIEGRKPAHAVNCRHRWRLDLGRRNEEAVTCARRLAREEGLFDAAGLPA